MKRMACLVVLSLTGSALALGPLGPTTTTLRQGQWEVGAAYTYSEQDLEVEGVMFNNMELQTVLARVAVGLFTNRVELFGLAGAADEDDYYPEAEFAAGIGLRVTTNDPGEKLSWGLVTQVVRAQFDLPSIEELTWNDFQIAIGPTWRCGDFMLYGGPMVQYVFGSLDSESFGDFDMDNAVFWGGYLGAGVTLWEHLTANVEGQLTTESQGLSAGLNWRF